jgi:hypothetical protein
MEPSPDRTKLPFSFLLDRNYWTACSRRFPPRQRSDASCRAMTVLDLMRTTNQIIAHLDRPIQ